MTAYGTLRGLGERFQGAFIAEERQIQVSGSFDKHLGQLSSPNLTLTYDNLEGLSGNYQIDPRASYVGTTDLNITAVGGNGQTVSIHGNILPPVSSRENVSGFIHLSIDE